MGDDGNANSDALQIVEASPRNSRILSHPFSSQVGVQPPADDVPDGPVTRSMSLFSRSRLSVDELVPDDCPTPTRSVSFRSDGMLATDTGHVFCDEYTVLEVWNNMELIPVRPMETHDSGAEV